jgi:hypothetical protein
MVMAMFASQVMWYPETVKNGEAELATKKMIACYTGVFKLNGKSAHENLVDWSATIYADWAMRNAGAMPGNPDIGHLSSEILEPIIAAMHTSTRVIADQATQISMLKDAFGLQVYT